MWRKASILKWIGARVLYRVHLKSKIHHTNMCCLAAYQAMTVTKVPPAATLTLKPSTTHHKLMTLTFSMVQFMNKKSSYSIGRMLESYSLPYTRSSSVAVFLVSKSGYIYFGNGYYSQS